MWFKYYSKLILLQQNTKEKKEKEGEKCGDGGGTDDLNVWEEDVDRGGVEDVLSRWKRKEKTMQCESVSFNKRRRGWLTHAQYTTSSFIVIASVRQLASLAILLSSSKRADSLLCGQNRYGT